MARTIDEIALKISPSKCSNFCFWWDPPPMMDMSKPWLLVPTISFVYITHHRTIGPRSASHGPIASPPCSKAVRSLELLVDPRTNGACSLSFLMRGNTERAISYQEFCWLQWNIDPLAVRIASRASLYPVASGGPCLTTTTPCSKSYLSIAGPL